MICTADWDLSARLQELTVGKGVERAIGCFAGELGAEVVRSLVPTGTPLVYGALSRHRQTAPAKFLMPLFAPCLIYSKASIRGWWPPRWVSGVLTALMAEHVQNPDLAAALEPVIDRRREPEKEVVRRVVLRRELPEKTDLDMAEDPVMGPLLLRMFFFAGMSVDRLLQALLARKAFHLPSVQIIGSNLLSISC